MAQHGLDGAQVGPPGQQVGGEGMPQGMRGDLCRIDTARRREFLDQQVEPVPRQMARRTARRKEKARHGPPGKARGLFTGIARGEPFRQSLPRGG